MVLTLKRNRTIGTDNPIVIRQYENERTIRRAIGVTLDRIHLLRDRVHGLTYRDFIRRPDLVQLCATDYMIVGNQLGMMDKILIDEKLRRDVYSFRSVVAHYLGMEEFNPSLLWSSIVYDLDNIETACLMALEILDRSDMICFENRKPRSYRSLHPY